MSYLISKHLLMYYGIQPNEIDSMPLTDVLYFQEFEREFRTSNSKAIAAELAKVISKMLGG